MYQTRDGCYKEYSYEKPRPTTKHGYGIYHGDGYLYRYIINESEAITDSTDFARWNDKTVIYFDVDTVGANAFTNAISRQGQVLYFTERLNCIMPDAFTDIMMLDNKQTEENPFGDLCIVFSGNAPSIDKSSISNYADTTYRITYVVPNLATYIESDIQWTYSQLVTIDDFVQGYISPENEVTVNDSTEVDASVDLNNTADAAELTATVGTDSIRITGYYMSNCGGGLYCVANARGMYTELIFHDGASANCIDYHYIDFMIPRFSEDIKGIDVVEPYPLKVKVIYSSITDIKASDTNAPYYDLMGRKVANPSRGIYIRNGRKVVK